jgi:hypothetical protein
MVLIQPLTGRRGTSAIAGRQATYLSFKRAFTVRSEEIGKLGSGYKN